MAKKVSFTAEHRDGYTRITIPDLIGYPVKEKYIPYLEVRGLALREYYYTCEFELGNGRFAAARIQKVGGAGSDGARGTEWYEKLSQRETVLIVNYIARNCVKLEK